MFDLPIVAIEPAVKPAVTSTKTGIVGVLATTVTLESPNVVRLLATYAVGTTVVSQPCPAGSSWSSAGKPRGRRRARRYTPTCGSPLVERGADTLVLGCTHYVFLEPLIREVAGPAVAVVNPAPAVARQLHRRLTAAGLRGTAVAEGSQRFYCTGDPAMVGAVLTKLWASPSPSSRCRAGNPLLGPLRHELHSHRDANVHGHAIEQRLLPRPVSHRLLGGGREVGMARLQTVTSASVPSALTRPDSRTRPSSSASRR